MFSSLSDVQREIVFSKTGKSVVRACPGSGKTYSISAKFAYMIQQWKSAPSGIATISFTNVAWREIEKKLDSHFGIETPVNYPHFLGTIDRFINKFIFLPFGHLIMGCGMRPTLVGEPHGTWSGGKHKLDYAQYFDKTSFDINGDLIRTGSVNLQWRKNDGTFTAHVKRLEDAKRKYWQKGYATQDDANYIALKLLEKYPKIAEAVVYRFPQFIIDEAQDTSEIQMAIIDILIANGLENIMLVGDPDQAIFEWNDAKPELFIEKFNDWRANSLILNENRRSSKLICDFTYNLSSLENVSTAIHPDVKDYDFDPIIETYEDGQLNTTIQRFLDLCKSHNIEVNEENVAVIYRSKSFYDQITGSSATPKMGKPWLTGHMVAKEMAQGKYLYENGSPKEGFKIIERAFYKAQSNINYFPQKNLDELIEKIGIIKWRTIIYELIALLPAIKTISDWINEANLIFEENGVRFRLKINQENSGVTLDDLFKRSVGDRKLGFRTGTIHTIKGETFEAVLVILKQKGSGPNYKTMLKKGLQTTDHEELRIAYVGLTRPRKLLVLAVPTEEDRKAWRESLYTD